MGSNTNAATGNSMDVPSSWRGLSREESAKLALYPFRALANLFNVSGGECLTKVHTDDLGTVIEALAKRAEVTLGVPDGSF